MICKLTFGTFKNPLNESQYNRLESSLLPTILKCTSPKLVDDLLSNNQLGSLNQPPKQFTPILAKEVI